MVGGRKLSAGYIMLVCILTIICLSMLYPFVNLLFVSFSDNDKVISAGGLLLYPQGITLDAYRFLVQYPNLFHSYRNTLVITLLGTSMAIVITTMGAYVLSRKEMPGRGIMTLFVVLTMFFSGGLIPGYINMLDLKLLNTLWVLMLPFCISTWNLLLERNFMMAIPGELIEAARIDGCTETKLLVRIVVPVSMPIIATLTLFYGVSRWNEYTNAVIYNSKSNMQTVQVIIRNMYDAATNESIYDTDIKPPVETLRAATVIFITLPILCVYPFLQKYFAQGLMVGSVKG